jgi:hypothetical protein
MTQEEALNTLSEEVAEIVLISVRAELEAQGHKMTGDLYNSIKYEIRSEAGKSIIDYFFLDYGMVQNYGIKADRIPFNPGSGAKKSKYIDGLVKFVQNRMGKSGKEAERIAFAIARKHKTEGMPTANSYSSKYTKNGRRLNWISEGIAEATPKVNEAISKYFPMVIDSIMISAFAEISKQNSKNLKVNIK